MHYGYAGGRTTTKPPAPLAWLDPLHYITGIFLISAACLIFLGGHRPSGMAPPCADPRAIIIGDVHGCAKELRALLRRVKIRPNCDCVYFTGDLMGKGPASVQVLREVCARALSLFL